MTGGKSRDATDARSPERANAEKSASARRASWASAAHLTVDVLAVVAVPLMVVAAVSVVTGWERPRLGWHEVFPVTPLGLLQGGWRQLEGVASSCELTALRPFAAVGYAATFFATVVLEAPFYALALGRRGLVRTTRILAWGNVATHPIVFFALPCLIPNYRAFVLGAELFAPAVEILLVLAMTRDARGPRPLTVVALITLANLASWQLGIAAYL